MPDYGFENIQSLQTILEFSLFFLAINWIFTVLL